jgi:hypothetical protein
MKQGQEPVAAHDICRRDRLFRHWEAAAGTLYALQIVGSGGGEAASVARFLASLPAARSGL